jgi:hypothetical protein
VAIPANSFRDDFLVPEKVDRSIEFSQKCGQNHFYVDPEEEGGIFV